MNKDLLIIFVVGPLVVEIGKAFIKEFQDRRNHERQALAGAKNEINPMMADIEKALIDYCNSPSLDKKMGLTGTLFNLSQKVFNHTKYKDIQNDFSKYMDFVGKRIFGLEKVKKDDIVDNLPGLAKAVLNKI